MFNEEFIVKLTDLFKNVPKSKDEVVTEDTHDYSAKAKVDEDPEFDQWLEGYKDRNPAAHHKITNLH